MTVNKGTHSEHHDYLYTCGYCNGKGVLAGISCPHCYALDYPALMIAFTTARGERYYAILKAILSIKGREIYDRAVEIDTARMDDTGKHLTYADLFHLFMEFDFPRNRFKPFVEWLEECNVVPSGTHDKMVRGGLKVKDALAKLGYSD